MVDSRTGHRRLTARKRVSTYQPVPCMKKKARKGPHVAFQTGADGKADDSGFEPRSRYDTLVATGSDGDSGRSHVGWFSTPKRSLAYTASAVKTAVHAGSEQVEVKVCQGEVPGIIRWVGGRCDSLWFGAPTNFPRSSVCGGVPWFGYYGGTQGSGETTAFMGVEDPARHTLILFVGDERAGVLGVIASNGQRPISHAGAISEIAATA